MRDLPHLHDSSSRVINFENVAGEIDANGMKSTISRVSAEKVQLLDGHDLT